MSATSNIPGRWRRPGNDPWGSAGGTTAGSTRRSSTHGLTGATIRYPSLADHLPSPLGEAHEQPHRPRVYADDLPVPGNLARSRIDAPGADTKRNDSGSVHRASLYSGPAFRSIQPLSGRIQDFPNRTSAQWLAALHRSPSNDPPPRSDFGLGRYVPQVGDLIQLHLASQPTEAEASRDASRG